MDWIKYWELGDTLNEFVDEYSCLFESADIALRQGISFSAVIKEGKLYPQLENCTLAHYLNPIDRVVQMSYWLKGDVELYSAKSFNEIIERFNLSYLHKTPVFIGDKISFKISQGRKVLAEFEGEVNDKNWFPQYSPNKKIINYFKTSFENTEPVTVTFMVTKPAPAREVFQGMFKNSNHDLFLNLLVEKFIKNPYKMEVPLDQIKSLPLSPKRVNTLHSLILERRNLIKYLQGEQEIYHLDPEDKQLVDFIKNKVWYYQKNQVPFTRGLSLSIIKK